MANNPYVNKVQLADGTTLIDLSTDTAVASDVAQGKYFHLPTGERVQGTATGGGGGTTWETLYEANNVYTEDWGDVVYYLPIYDYFQTHSDLIVGDTYRITWEGVQYTQEAFSGDIGGTGAVLGSPDMTFANYPFACQKFNGDDLWFLSNDHTDMFNLKIEHQISSGGSTLITKTITANGTYDAEDDDADGYSEVTVAIPSGTEGTPTATKGSVSNHSVSVTPSVINTAGVITGGTKTGTAVTVTASELASGNKEITANGNNIDVVGYSTVSVAVPSGGGGLEYETGTFTPSEDVARPTISFAKTHTNPPKYIVFTDETGTDDYTNNTNWAMSFISFDNNTLPWSQSATRYAIVMTTYRSTSASMQQSTSSSSYPYSNTGDSSSSYFRYWATNSTFIPSSNSTSRYWRSGRTYKWVAVWAPTT